MNGEDVCGSKITTHLAPLDAYDSKMQMMQNLSGNELARTFPPRAPPRPVRAPGFHSPNPPSRRMMYPPPPRGPLPQIGRPVQNMYPPRPHVVMAPRFPPPPMHVAPPNAPPPQLPRGPIPRPEGKILIYKIPPLPDTEIDHLNGQVVSLRLAASIKVSVLVVYYEWVWMHVVLHIQ